MRDIGSAGEHFFMGFCFADGVNANKCGADKNGWDVIMEVDQDPRQLSQHTLHEPIITAKVQVQSTRKKSLKVDVTLSNLRKMATSPLPTFYVLLDFSEGAPPRRAFLRHMDEALIKETLERVNALLVEGNAHKLHKSTMRVDFEQGREIALNDSDTFKRAVLDAVGRSASGYADRKSAFLRDVGNSDGSHLLRFEIQGIESLTALVNATLGMGGDDPSAQHANVHKAVWYGGSWYHVFSSHYEILYKTVLRAQELSREKVLQQIEVLTERYAAPLPVVNLIPVMLNLDSPA